MEKVVWKGEEEICRGECDNHPVQDSFAIVRGVLEDARSEFEMLLNEQLSLNKAPIVSVTASLGSIQGGVETSVFRHDDVMQSESLPPHPDGALRDNR
jgi:hypothetical protein